MYVYLLRIQSIQISKTKLLVKMASESERFVFLFFVFLQTWWDKIFRKLSTIGIYEDIVNQIQHGLFREVVKITGPSGSNLTHPTPRDQ